MTSDDHFFPSASDDQPGEDPEGYSSDYSDVPGNWLDGLNPQQFEAVTTTEGPLLVIAGAGSGKTRVITHRIAYLIREKGVHPREIFAATFTNKAATEMKERVRRILNLANPPYMSIATFHSLCVAILRAEAYQVGLSNNFMIADDRDASTLMTEVLKDLKIGKDILHPKQARWMVGQLKMRMLPFEKAAELMENHIEEVSDTFEMGFAELPEELDGADLGELMVKTAKLYQQRLKANDAVDFDDLINYVVKLFEESPETLTHYQDRYRYLMVDEYQDTNLAQFRLISALAQRDRNLCVVGDEDQSIYSWRGAELSNLLEFQKQYSEAKLIKLEQNYRSTGHVLAAASSVIHNNTERIGKTLWTESGDGLPIARFTAGSDLDEAEGIALLIERIVRNTQYSYNDIAVFYRVKSLSRTYEEGMRRYDLPYQVVGGTGFYDRAEIRDLTAYLRLTVNPHQNMSLIRVINTPRRGVGNKTLDNLLQSANKKGVSLFQEILAALDEGTLKGKAKQALANLALQMQAWQTAAANESPEHLLRQILADTQYEAHLGDPSHLDVRGRLDNIEQLASALQAYHMDNPAGGLAGWLEQVALQSDQDDIDASKDKVSLMTLHAAKGLEFPVVFIVGLEEPLFPNRRATEERGNEEEERRLFYVGITRAERLLVLTHAERRVTHGDLRFNDPSTFLYEVPEDLITRIERLDIRDIDDLTTGRRGSPESLLEAQIERERHDRDMKGAGRGQQNRVANIMNRYGNADALPSYETMVPDDSADQREAEAEHGYDDATIQEMNRGGQQAEVWDATPSKYISGSGRRRKVMPKLRGGNKRESGAGKNFLPWVQLGKRVSHAMLGEGIVIGLSGAGAEKKILIQFDDGDEREMLAEYADLSPCD